MTPDLKQYLKMCCRGFARRQGKKQLSEQFGICQKTVRVRIHELRSEGVLIVSNSKFKGYWFFDIDNHTEFETEQYGIMIVESCSRRKQMRETEDAMNKKRFPALEKIGLLGLKER